DGIFIDFSDSITLMSFPTRRSSDLVTDQSKSPSAIRPERHPFQLSQVLGRMLWHRAVAADLACGNGRARLGQLRHHRRYWRRLRSEEHTSELQSREKVVCRLLLENK